MADAGDRADQVVEPLKGLHHHLDPRGELVDRVGVPVDQVQMDLRQERVVLVEPPVQRLGQLGDLVPQPTLGQIGQHDGVVVAGDQRVEHQPTGHPEDVGGNGRQLDPGVLQQLLQPLGLPGTLTGDRGPRPGQVPQLADRLGRHERGLHQAVRAELREPGRVRDIGLTARDRLHVPGIDQHHLDAGQVIEQVVERFPVVPGRLHHHTRDLLGGQVLTQRQDLAGHRPPRRDCLDRLAPTGTGHPDAHLGVPLRDIHPGTPGVNDFHHHHFPSARTSVRPSRGGQGDSKV